MFSRNKIVVLQDLDQEYLGTRTQFVSGISKQSKTMNKVQLNGQKVTVLAHFAETGRPSL